VEPLFLVVLPVIAGSLLLAYGLRAASTFDVPRSAWLRMRLRRYFLSLRSPDRRGREGRAFLAIEAGAVAFAFAALNVIYMLTT
jgi:hypothetical protein